MNSEEKKEREEEIVDQGIDVDQENDTALDECEGEIVSEEETTSMEAQLGEMQDKYLRLAAEFDNYRKRTIKEKAELIKNGGEKVISSILPVIDDLERALKTMQSTEDTAALVEGVELIYNKFISTLQQNGLQKIQTNCDTAFDTDYHEAIAIVPAPQEVLKGKILDTVQNGYMLNDKVIRHAKVVVGE